jgi:hypothetical protein
MVALALLEVMDKEASVPEMWFGAVVFGGIGFWSARRWVWPGPLFLAWLAFGLWAVHGELTDRSIGPAILEETGRSYPVHAYLSSALATAAVLTGLLWGNARWWKGRGMHVEHPARGAASLNPR